MIGGAHLSVGRGEGRRRPEAGVLSYDGGGNRAGRHWLTDLLADGEWQRPMKEWASTDGLADWGKIKGDFYNIFDFFNVNGFRILSRFWKFGQEDLG
jgi:hypothetical protein